ncbi:MAG TPA: ammonium transporter, partial [Burkholderiaceae bacterium]|nr:ammonium transporter [Burkholderiaceae bacterium]
HHGAQLLGTVMAVAWALIGGFGVYGAIKGFVGLRLSQEEEYEGADLSIHKIGSTPDREVSW